MTIRLPAELEELKYIVGFELPAADEDALRRCGGAWRRAAARLRAVRVDAEAVGPAVSAALGGEPGAAVDARWREAVVPGAGYFDQLAAACDQLADACEHASVEVEYAKLEFVGALVVLAIALAIAAWWFIFGGVSAVGVPFAIAAAQNTIRLVLTRLVASVVIAEVFTVGLDGLAQMTQLFAGHRDHWDWAATGRAAEDGVVYGVVNAAAFGLAGRFAPRLAGSLPGRAALSGATGILGATASAYLHGERPTGSDFLLSLSSGLAGGGVGHRHDGGGDLDRRVSAAFAHLDPFWYSTVDEAAPADPSAPAQRRAQPPAEGADSRDPQLSGSVLGPAGRTMPSDPHPELDVTTGPPDRPGTGAPVPPEGAPPSVMAANEGAAASTAAPTGGAVPTHAIVGTAPGGRAGRVGVPDPTAVPVTGHGHPDRITPSRASAGTADGSAGSGRAAVADTGQPDSAVGGQLPSGRVDFLAELSDQNAHDLVRDTVFTTNAGLGFYVDADSTRDFARAVEPTDGYVTLDLHGSTDGFYIDEHKLTPAQFARALRELVADGVLHLAPEQGIKLLSCQTAHGGRESPAAALARELGVDVIAPDDVVWTSMAGDEIVSSPTTFAGYIIPTYPPDGGWQRFTPAGAEVALSFDPGYHGPPVDGGRPLSQFDAERSTGPPAEDDWAARGGHRKPPTQAPPRPSNHVPPPTAFGRHTPGWEPFPGTEHSLDEMVEFCNGHTGDGDPRQTRPTRERIEETLRTASPEPLRDGQAARYVKGTVTVIINRVRPERSTAWFLTDERPG